MVEEPQGDYDYYEQLQVSPSAEPDTIHRVYRLLAQRFPFAVYYKLDGDACIVWRVLDCRQNPAKIASELQRGR